jgi:Ni,Fe-hydrogenase III small subunit
VLTAINIAWKGKPWDKVEILTGKTMKPTPGMNKTVLLGKCMYKANKDHPDIKEMIPVKGCPPNPEHVVKALHQAGIDVDAGLFKNMDHLPGFFMSKYKNKSEFDENFFKVKEI